MQHTHQLRASQHRWHTIFFFPEDMRHLQTLVVIMMTTVMIFAAPKNSRHSPNRTHLDDNDKLMRSQIIDTATKILGNASVRKNKGTRLSVHLILVTLTISHAQVCNQSQVVSVPYSDRLSGTPCHVRLKPVATLVLKYVFPV